MTLCHLPNSTPPRIYNLNFRGCLGWCFDITDSVAARQPFIIGLVLKEKEFIQFHLVMITLTGHCNVSLINENEGMSVMQLDAVLLGDVQLNAHYDIFFSLFQLN